MLFPRNWMLPLGGAIVGGLTNLIALKFIFWPVNPVNFGPFKFQGIFLARQKEVSEEFAKFMANNVMNSQRVWQDIVDGPDTSAFKAIMSTNSPMGAD